MVQYFNLQKITHSTRNITRLGPDALKSKFDIGRAKERLKERGI
jgi:hypothetical protein